MSWREYWESDSSVYVSNRHKQVHYELLAAQLSDLVPSADATVLDYGCGDALVADRLAGACGQLLLLDGAQSVRARLRQRFAGVSAIRVLAPEDLEREPERSFDLVIINSVLQYLTPAECDAMLALLARKLEPAGAIVIGDVVPPSVGPVQDTAALLRFAREHGFFVAALTGLVRAALSGYGAKRSALGLTRYDEPRMLEALRRAGLTGERMARNLGHNQARMAFRARLA